MLTHSGKILTAQQISELEDFKNELERNFQNTIDADTALKERQEQRDKKYSNQTHTTPEPSEAAGKGAETHGDEAADNQTEE